MRRHNISSLVVCEAGSPLGILTDRDLRNKVVARGIDPGSLTVAEVMNSPVITISEDEYLFEALHRLSRHRIHRLVVTGKSGGLAGIITDSDILRIQTRSPQQLVREIEEAATLEELKGLHQRVQGMVRHLIVTGVHISDMVRLIAHLNDRIIVRLIELVRTERFAALTGRFAFLVLGSEGRGEQTLTTDQDNAIVYADDSCAGGRASAGGVQYAADREPDRYRRAIMPRRHHGKKCNVAAESWPVAEVLDQWFSIPTPENILNVSMFSDLRLLSGDPSLETGTEVTCRRKAA